MRAVENVLLILGITVLATVAGFYVVVLPLLLIFGRSKPDGVGGAGYALWFVMMIGFVGAGVGAIVGLRQGIRLMNGRSSDAWKPSVWIGIGVAMVLALAIILSGWLANHGGMLFVFGEWWWGKVIFVIGLGTVGGIAGNLIGKSMPDVKSQGKKKKRRRQEKLD